jgi:hypothetical protein
MTMMAYATVKYLNRRGSAADHAGTGAERHEHRRKAEVEQQRRRPCALDPWLRLLVRETLNDVPASPDKAAPAARRRGREN